MVHDDPDDPLACMRCRVGAPLPHRRNDPACQKYRAGRGAVARARVVDAENRRRIEAGETFAGTPAPYRRKVKRD